MAKPTIHTIDRPNDETEGRRGRAISFPLNALLVLAIVAAANMAVYMAGQTYFVQVPSPIIPIRNIALALALLAGGRALIGRMKSEGKRGAELLLLCSVLLFGVGLAMQYRIGHDMPRQLSGREIALVSDTVRFRMEGAAEDTIQQEIGRTVRRYNAELRRDFDRTRIDIRLARALEQEYGPSDTTDLFLEDRPVASMDPLWFRLLPVVGFLLLLFLIVHTGLPRLLTSQWRAIGLYGSLGLCILAFFYLGAVGGIRGASLSPQELLKITIPVAWAGLLIHYRHVFTGESLAKMTDRPVLLWLYVLLLMALPLGVFVAVRDFGQFLTIGLTQILLLAWFSRRPLYIILFGGALVITSIILIGDSIAFASPLVLVLVTVALVVTALGALERFRIEGALWPVASIVLAGFGLLAWGASLLPFVREMLATPRSRFVLWANLYARDGNPAWWDNARQVIESLYAYDAGGLFGAGLGEGSPFLIPKSGSDFMFAAIVEETGFLGGLLIVLVILGLVTIGLRLAAGRGRASFHGLLIAGYAILLGVQSLVHIAGTMNIMPMTGITLPLVSSGTSSLLVTWSIIAIIVGLAVRQKKRAGGEEFVIVRKKAPVEQAD